MHIGINLLYLIPGKSGGTETYVKNLLKALLLRDSNNSYTVYMPEEALTAYSEYRTKARCVGIRNIFGSKLLRIVYEQLMLPMRIFHDRVDVLFSPGYVVPVLASCCHVVTVHDMLYKRYPGTIPFVKRMYWSMFIPLSFWRSSKILAVSEFVRSEFEKYFPQYRNKYIVSYESVDKNIFFPEQASKQLSEQYGLPDEFILSVATISPHKNLESVLTAVHILKQKNIIVNVVFVGNKERSIRQLYALIDLYGLQRQVYFTGFVPEHDLRAVYSHASLFVMPSLYEGFGLPILESMACGCPVVSSDAGSLREIGGDAAEYFSPENADALSLAIEKIYRDKNVQQEMRQAGFAQLKKYDWNTTAAITIEAFESSSRKL